MNELLLCSLWPDGFVCVRTFCHWLFPVRVSLSLSFFYFYFRNSSSSSFPSSSQLSAALCRLYCKQGRCKNTTHTHTDRQLSDDNGVEMEMEEDGKERKKGHWQVELVGASRKKKKKQKVDDVFDSTRSLKIISLFFFGRLPHCLNPTFHAFLPSIKSVNNWRGRQEGKKERREPHLCHVAHDGTRVGALVFPVVSGPVRSSRID